jgi:hypothetical protein
MRFAELMKRIQLSPSRKLTYFEKYRNFIDKEKLFLEEMVRISYNLGMQDVTKEHIENYQRLFPEPEIVFRGEQSETRILSEERTKILTGLNIPKRVKRAEDSERSERSKTAKENLTGLKSKRGKNVRTKQTTD